MENIVAIKSIEQVTPDVKRFVVEKPDGYTFKPGQASHISIAKEGWKDEDRPFTFTSLPDWTDLEFTIKIYRDHDGVTEQLSKLKAGDTLILREAGGAIQYKGDGYFIAGGAGVTPFISIFRQLKKEGKLDNNHLIFSNKTDKDIILKNEFDNMQGLNTTYVVTDQDDTQHTKAYLDKDFLKSKITDFNKHFYVCGPPNMTDEIVEILENLGAETDSVVLDN
ncbi:FAD-binding oxidoreductase [Zunongwangia sp.]|uniref:FAD-binding oxidoreductase n=1 Tax=Zunongwangia sp. TaxID=1965325 RepID=UPI003AA9ABBD